jgi:hypothetical protein
MLALAVLMTFVFAGNASGQVSTSHDLRWAVLASGGGSRQSATFAVRDVVGQAAGDISTSAAYRIAGGFLPMPAGGVAPVVGDSFEDDDGCYVASALATGAAPQLHTFHDRGDQDWVKFTAVANKTYIIEVNGLSDKTRATIALHDACDAPFSGQGSNAFGTTVRLEWDSRKFGDFYLKFQQFDPTVFGSEVKYTVKVSVDGVPPSAPTDTRCFSISDTTMGMQWKRSPERDVVKYQVRYNNLASTDSRVKDVVGGATTYVELGQLNQGEKYSLGVVASDFSGNLSPESGRVECVAVAPPDRTKPTLVLQQPTGAALYTTTAGKLTFTGQAQDTGKNLSRVQVRNTRLAVEGWDYSLAGAQDSFRVPDVSIGPGDNSLEVTVYDAAGNSTKQTLLVRRQGDVGGAVLIVAGHNEDFGLQTNIYNAANRAFRIFRSAGFSADDIYYIAPVMGQDADGDGAADVDEAGSAAAVEKAIKTWAATGGRVGADDPFVVYLVDHGETDKFCVKGCIAGGITPKQLDTWLRALESATGVKEVTVVIEACRSGSFLDRTDIADGTLAKQNRVIISSTGRSNNAYASAEGAYFSDVFFSCVADSKDLKTCFEQGRLAVANVTGIDQTPWLDDNADGRYGALGDTAPDGAVAGGRYITRFFSSIRPRILSTKLDRQGANGTLEATVQEGAEAIDVVWAAVFPPSFKEPSLVTLNLNVPTVRLEADPATPGRYFFNYVNGFTEKGDYRIVFYAQDSKGIHAEPKRVGEGLGVYLPLIYQSPRASAAGSLDAAQELPARVDHELFLPEVKR